MFRYTDINQEMYKDMRTSDIPWLPYHFFLHPYVQILISKIKLNLRTPHSHIMYITTTLPHTYGHTPNLLVYGMHGDCVITTPLHDAEEDSTKAESSSRSEDSTSRLLKMAKIFSTLHLAAY